MSEQATKRYKIRITGRVQGVFFRDSTRQEAHKLGLKGFVRNEADGSVYLEAEGASEALEALREWVQDGPSHADVDSVELETAEPHGYKSFEIAT